MLDQFIHYDQDVMQRLLRWSLKYWGRPYAVDFQCAHPWVFLMNDIYHKNLMASLGPDSAYLANFWYTHSSELPQGRDNLAFRFQQDDEEVSTLRPDGIVHIELIIGHDVHNNCGICLGVGAPAGATPLNGTFGLHPYAVGMLGDGWFDDSPTKRTHIRYVNVEFFPHS